MSHVGVCLPSYLALALVGKAEDGAQPPGDERGVLGVAPVVVEVPEEQLWPVPLPEGLSDGGVARGDETDLEIEELSECLVLQHLQLDQLEARRRH